MGCRPGIHVAQSQKNLLTRIESGVFDVVMDDEGNPYEGLSEQERAVRRNLQAALGDDDSRDLMKSNRIASADDKNKGQVTISTRADKGQGTITRDKGQLTMLRTNIFAWAGFGTRDMISHSGSELEVDARGLATSSTKHSLYDQGVNDAKAYFQKHNLILGTLMVWSITLVLPIIATILGNEIEMS